MGHVKHYLLQSTGQLGPRCTVEELYYPWLVQMFIQYLELD